MATTTAQEGKLSKQRVSTPTQPRGFSFHTGLTIWKSQVDRAFIRSSLARGQPEGLPMGQLSSSWPAGHSISTPGWGGGAAGVAGSPGAENRGGFPRALCRASLATGPQSTLPCVGAGATLQPNPASTREKGLQHQRDFRALASACSVPWWSKSVSLSLSLHY